MSNIFIFTMVSFRDDSQEFGSQQLLAHKNEYLLLFFYYKVWFSVKESLRKLKSSIR